MKQTAFQKIHWKHRYSHGGSLRQLRAGRGARPLSTKASLHLVLKANRERVRGGLRVSRRFQLIHFLIQKYAVKFFIKVEQASIQNDHIHLLIRTSRRSLYQHFFRVLAGQIAQRFEKEGLLSVCKTQSPAGVSVTQAESLAVTDTPTGSSAEAKVPRVTGTPGRGIAVEGEGLEAERSLGVSGACGAPIGEVAKGLSGGDKASATKLQKLWKYRPFTRVVRAFRDQLQVRDYIQLNEKEALRDIPYRKRRLRGLSSTEWERLWR